MTTTSKRPRRGLIWILTINGDYPESAMPLDLKTRRLTAKAEGLSVFTKNTEENVPSIRMVNLLSYRLVNFRV